MLPANRSQLARNTVVAALVGSACGALAGVWSVYRMPSVRTPVAQPQMTTEVISSTSSSSPPRKKAAEPIPVHVEAQPASASPAAVPASSLPARALNAPVAASALAAVNAQQVLERARALAQRADVKALVELRDAVVLRAAERGEENSAATKQQLDELDRDLAQARALRLKIDAMTFRKSASAPNPDR